MVWLLPVTAFVGGLIVVASVPLPTRGPVAWFALAMLVLSAAVAWAARHQRERAKSSQQQLAQAETAYSKRVAAVEATFSQQLASVEATLGGLVAAIPEAVERVRRGEDALDVSVSLPSLPPFCGPGLTGAYGRLARLVLDAEERSTGTSESVRRGFKTLGERMQGVHNKVLGKLRELQGEHQHNPPVFALLLELDHRVSGAARLGDSLVVIGGGGALRRWDSPKSLFTVLQGAQSRISEYQRVELERVPVIGINGPAVEAVTHLLAELLDNATTFSPPSTTVRVSAERGPAGVYLDIVDRGVGMAPDKVAWARQLLAGETSVSLEDLGETPHVGLTVATLLARQCGIRLELSRSGLKGTRASVLLPDTLLTAAPDPDPVRDAVQGPDQSPAPVPVSVGLAEAAGDAVDESKGRTPTGLPRRRIGLPDSPGAPQPSPSGASGPEVPPAVRRDAMTVFAQRPAAAAAPPAYPSNSELSSTEDK